MSSKECKVCGKRKVKTEFYATSGLTCKSCKNKLDIERAKDSKSVTVSMLYEILNKQRHTEEVLLSRLDDMELEINKLRKQLKKIAVS